MICPNCNTQNDPSNQYCMQCGKPLSNEVPNQQPLAHTVRDLLGLLTFRIIIFLLVLWFIQGVLVQLPFIRDLQIPNFPIPASVIVTSIINLVIIGLLLGYSRTLWVLWNQSFPRYGSFGSVLVIAVYLVVLVLVYQLILPWLTANITNAEPITIFQIVMGIITFALVIYLLIVVYQRLPDWLSKIRQDMFTMPPVNQVACLNCGHLNNQGQAFCGHCGNALMKTA